MEERPVYSSLTSPLYTHVPMTLCLALHRLSDNDSKVTIEGEEEENKDGKEHDVESDGYINPKFRDVPTIYACATMWHENKQEMVQLMKSIFRYVLTCVIGGIYC